VVSSDQTEDVPCRVIISVGAAAPERGPMTAVRLGHSGAWRAAVVPRVTPEVVVGALRSHSGAGRAAEGDLVRSRFGLSAC